MQLSQVKALLPTLENIAFKLENGTSVPAHFHITEIGMVTKNFIDCGGVIRQEQSVSFQLWSSIDIDHRLSPQKLLSIIELSENKLGIADAAVEVEYQTDTIGKYDLAFDGKYFILVNKFTACLAEDKCGIQEKQQLNLADLTANKQSCCSPESGCCQ